ncbi:MAG: hypothetical protein ACM4AI_16295 [Acidobacteriota bacterium]
MPEVKNDKSTVNEGALLTEKKPLPSPGFAPKHQDTRGMRFTVSDGGDIHVPPVKFRARRGDFLLWAVVNHSGGPISVAITDFRRKATIFDNKGVVPIAPVDFFGGVNGVNLQDGESKVIGGALNAEPEAGPPFFTDGVSYVIEVRSTAEPKKFADVDYDPDGEIKP